MAGKIEELEAEVRELRAKNTGLNLALMRKSAEASEAQEKLRRWEVELRVLADQKGHNLCQIGIPQLLKNTIGYSGKYPDTEGITREEFRAGCDAYIDDLFGSLNK